MFSVWVSSAHYFFVIGLTEMFILIFVVAAWYALISQLAPESSIALFHFIAALLIHPALEFKDASYLSTYEQFEALNSLRRSQNVWTHFDISSALSKSLMEDSVRELRISNPWEYWLFPPSVCLVIWGGIIFKFLPKND